MASSPMITTLVGQDRSLTESTKLTLALESISLRVDLTAQDVIAHSPRKTQPYDGMEMKPTTIIEHPDRDRLHRESCRYFLYHLFRGHRNRDWRSQAVFDDDDEPSTLKRSFPKSVSGMKSSSVQKFHDKTIVIINEEEIVDMIG